MCLLPVPPQPAASPPSRFASGPCHGLGPHQALASSPHGTSGACRRCRHSFSLSHRWPSALTLLVLGQLASSTPDLGALAATLPTSMSSGHEPAACAHCDASSQACQTLSASCGQPSGQQSMVMSTVASATLSLVGQLPGITASRSSLCQMSQVSLAPDPSTHAPWMHRSRPCPAPVRDRRPTQPLIAAPAQPAELTPRQRVCAALRSDDTDIAARSAALDRQDRWWSGVCCTASSSLEPSTQGNARVTPLPACSLPGAAGHPQPCHAQLPSLPGTLAVVWRRMDSSDPAASTSTACRSAGSRR